MGLSKRILSAAVAVSLFSVLPATQVSLPVTGAQVTAYADALGGKEVTVEGEGENKERAVANARRMAVEQALGAYVSSVTDVKNFQVVKDEIRTEAEGYTGEVEILDEKAGAIYWVKIKTTVSQVPLIKKLAMKGLLRQWRVGVLIKPPNKSDFTADEAAAYRDIVDATEQAETKMNELLSNAGFKTINTGENPQVRAQILAHISDLNALAATASKVGMDVLIVGTAKVKFGQANNVESYGGVSVKMVPAVATLNLKAIKVSTREVIAAKAFVPTAENGNMQYSLGNGFGPASIKAMQDSAEVAGSDMLVNVAKLPASAAAMLTVVIRNISSDRADDIEDALKTISGITSVNAEDFANNQAQFELKVTGSAKEAAKLVRKALAKLKLNIMSSDSAKIVASGK